MLAKADATGFVEAALPGLARVSNLSLDETRVAVAQLEGPDPHSKNPANEGRRVIHVPERGGWQIINYQAYRERRNDEERQAYMRQYMKDYRSEHVNKRKQSVNNVSKCKPSVSHGKPPLAHAEGEAEGDGEVEAAATPPPYSPADCKDQPMEDASASMFMERTWMDWKLEVGRHRVYIDREGNSEAHWAALYGKSGWDEFTKAWNYCAGKSNGKVFLSNMMEVLK